MSLCLLGSRRDIGMVPHVASHLSEVQLILCRSLCAGISVSVYSMQMEKGIITFHVMSNGAPTGTCSLSPG